jgi:hypothetical protein
VGITPSDALKAFLERDFDENNSLKMDIIISSLLNLWPHCLAFNEYRMMQGLEQQRLWQKCLIRGAAAAAVTHI